MGVLNFDCEFKLASLDEKSGAFSAYGSVYRVVDLQQDVVMPGAFKHTLEARGDTPLPLLWSHLVSEPLGVAHAKEDSHGLQVAGELVLSVPRAAEVRDLMKAGAVRGMSIGYRTQPGWSKVKGEIRELHRVDLLELSLCVLPANESAVVTSPPKSAAAMTPEDWTRHFRGTGFSRSEADRLVWAVKQAFKNDVVDEDGAAEVLKFLRGRRTLSKDSETPEIERKRKATPLERRWMHSNLL
jgi:HK97 family phage prohead protease